MRPIFTVWKNNEQAAKVIQRLEGMGEERSD